MKNFTTTIAVVCLTACSTTNKPNIAIGPNGPVDPKQKQIFGQVIPSSPTLTNKKLKNPHKLFEALYHQSYCAEFPTTSADVTARANCATYSLAPIPSTSKKAEAMLFSGFAYSELLCDRYFNVLASRNQDLGFGIQGFGLLSGFTTSVLGITGSPAKSIALVSAGFAGTIAGMESYQQNYHFGPDVHAVRKLIMDGQRDYQNTITGDGLTNLTHYDAISHLKRHQSICQVDTIKSWVTAAVEEQKITFKTTARDDFYSSTALLGFRQKVGTALGLSGPLPSDQVTNLIWLTEVTTTKDVRHKYLRGELGESLAGKFLNPQGNKKTDSQSKSYQSAIVNAFSQLPAEAKIRQRRAAENLNNTAEAADKAATKSPANSISPKEALQSAIDENQNITDPKKITYTGGLEARSKQ